MIHLAFHNLKLSQIQPLFMQPGGFHQERKINVIEYSQSSRRANLFTKRGKQAQTAALNINLKTINKNILIKMPSLSNDEKKIIVDYMADKANFSTTRKLYGLENNICASESHRNIQRYMRSYYQNTKFVQNILQNDNMDYPNKLILLKFLEKIRESAIDPKKHTNWKQKF